MLQLKMTDVKIHDIYRNPFTSCIKRVMTAKKFTGKSSSFSLKVISPYQNPYFAFTTYH